MGYLTGLFTPPFRFLKAKIHKNKYSDIFWIDTANKIHNISFFADDIFS